MTIGSSISQAHKMRQLAVSLKTMFILVVLRCLLICSCSSYQQTECVLERAAHELLQQRMNHAAAQQKWKLSHSYLVDTLHLTKEAEDRAIANEKENAIHLKSAAQALQAVQSEYDKLKKEFQK